MFHTAPGAGGTTAGTTSLSVMSVTVPAQGVPGNVFVQVHAYVTFSTSGDGFELYIADSTNPSGQLVSARINTIAGTVREVNVAPHLMLPVANGLVRTYQFRLQRTGGTGTASAFGDPRYLRMTALWIPT